MADYNIYIHNADGSSMMQAPTQAWIPGESNPVTKAWQPKGQESDGSAGAGSSIPPVAAYQGIKTAAKAHPAIAIAIACVAIADKIVTTIEPFVTREGGDYRFQKGYSNVKTVVKSIINPAGVALQWFTAQQEQRLYNQKQEQERLLIGESMVNSPIKRY